MIDVKFNGETYRMPAGAALEDIRNLLKEQLPEVANAEASTDDEGNITFRTASGGKGSVLA